MPEITNERELFTHELGDILYVERKLVSETLPKLIGEVQDPEFKAGLEKHLGETRGHVQNVEKVFELIGEEPKAEPCLGFEGLEKEHEKLAGEAASDLIDLVDLGAAARTENYEIAAYEALRRMAKALGEDKAVDLLDENLKQEKEALREVEKLATRVSNEMTTAAATVWPPPTPALPSSRRRAGDTREQGGTGDGRANGRPRARRHRAGRNPRDRRHHRRDRLEPVARHPDRAGRPRGVRRIRQGQVVLTAEGSHRREEVSMERPVVRRRPTRSFVVSPRSRTRG